jgi:hypothetical protein
MEDPLHLGPSLMVKVMAGLGGFLGGATFMAFYKPKGVWDAAVRSSICTGSAIIGAGPLLLWMNMATDNDHILLAGSVIGFCSWSVLSLIAHLLMDIQDERVQIKLPGFIERKSSKE